MDIFRHLEQLIEMRVNHAVTMRIREHMLVMYDSLNEKFEALFNEKMADFYRSAGRQYSNGKK